MAMAMDIEVIVGEDKLSFAGFGLTANLQGHVHIGDNMDTRGELWLNDGRYSAYGQRLQVRRARLLFAGPLDQPYLDIEAIRQTDDVIAGIRANEGKPYRYPFCHARQGRHGTGIIGAHSQWMKPWPEPTPLPPFPPMARPSGTG